MDVYGMDFTSRPSKRKGITWQHCWIHGNVVHALESGSMADFKEFDNALRRPGPWIAGIDFPFGQSRTFIEGIAWPPEWSDYVRYVGRLKKSAFEETLTKYRNGQPKGKKEHRRQTDVLAGSVSPQKLYGVPVGKMFYQGAPRLLKAGVTVPRLICGDPNRIVVEAYPGVLARRVSKCSYKNDTRKKQTSAQGSERRKILEALKSGFLSACYGLTVQGTKDAELVGDPSGDRLDALLCAVQAAWAWKNGTDFLASAAVDSREGWIADPGAV